VEKEIQAFTEANKTYSRADSLFIAKHLSVVYAANPTTREKGKHYMVILLEKMPGAELVDMFVSDEIARIFEYVRKELQTRVTRDSAEAKTNAPENPSDKSPALAAAPVAASKSETMAAPLRPGGGSPDAQAPPMWKRKAFWITGCAGVAVAGTVIAVVAMQPEKSPVRTHIIPATNQ
jgi:hypothetical protein